MQTSQAAPTTDVPQAQPGDRPWLRRPAVLTAIAGGVLAVTAFLSGAAVGHAWDGNSTGNGPGGGRFGNPNFQGGPPGSTNQNGTQNSVVVPTAATVPATGHRHPAIGLGVYEVWLTPATIPDPVTRSV